MIAALLVCALWFSLPETVAEATKPNILVMYIDDISPRELGFYNAPSWVGGDDLESTDENLRAKTPMLDMLARDGVYFTKAWAAPACSRSQAMLFTGQFANLTERYLTSPIQIGHLARKAGYRTMWVGKPGMKTADLLEFGFDEGLFSPNPAFRPPSPYSPEFRIERVTRDGRQVNINADTGKRAFARPQRSHLWKPHVDLINFPGTTENLTYWPNTDKLSSEYGLSTYGPDVLCSITINIINHSNSSNPIIIFHKPNLGQKSFNFIQPEKGNDYPPTPKLTWDEATRSYTRSNVTITGSAGSYETEGINDGGLHRQIEYVDYMLWQYVEQLKKSGIMNNTVIILASDNGTTGWGKNSSERQKGPHVPLLVYAPGMNLTKQGKQEELVNVGDLLPTLADIMGVEDVLEKPVKYEKNGVSLWPYLTTSKRHHRNMVYSCIREKQMIRGKMVMQDGNGDWWRVDQEAEDYDSYPSITDWSALPIKFRRERDNLIRIMKKCDV
eukprot:CAMPEP_0184744754 /NCGR_PEP_ID=MMETSP0315-20130426/7447_1 /TAXON_ID=101924 /ORGANISM="Rhodosorus marinus, Strain UTEX LB 2760" /LENGTH=499 /DNA_ID=CAMNT_0027216575 /DNA_START=382 /DNA_END=1881 /DNA_ORIENTATION=-